MGKTTKGFRVVLTADRSLMADYRVLLDAMVAAAQTTMVPRTVMRTFLAPALRSGPGDSTPAPMGLRRVEAALRAGGFGPEDVAIVPPGELARAIGPETRIVGVSSGDPLGRGMNSTTMSGLAGGRPYTTVWFEQLLRRVRKLADGSRVKVVMGGPGAWQLADDEPARRRLRIDHVVLGYCEDEIAAIFERISQGIESHEVIECTGPLRTPPNILGPTLMGVLEISRGCGLGCSFCTLADQPMLHLPVESVLADALVNVRRTAAGLSLISEDVFRYGGTGTGVNPDALKELLHTLRRDTGVRRMHVDHANIASVARFSDADLAEVRELLTGGDPAPYLWVNLGVETASPRLAEHNCAAKLHPHSPDGWPDLCFDQVRRLAAAGFVPMVSLLMGLSGESEDDAALTLRWVERLRGMRVTVFPMFVAPIEPSQKPFTARDMTSTHWRLLREAYRLNFKWFPRLVADNFRSAGVPAWRRLALQVMGRTAIPFVKAGLALKCCGRKP